MLLMVIPFIKDKSIMKAETIQAILNHLKDKQYYMGMNYNDSFINYCHYYSHVLGDYITDIELSLSKRIANIYIDYVLGINE